MEKIITQTIALYVGETERLGLSALNVMELVRSIRSNKMAFYKNQSDMFTKRAENCKNNGDRYYALAIEAKENGDNNNYKNYMAQAQYQYKSQNENEKKTKEHFGKEWDGVGAD
jgi:ABC-type ATPase with predicted acetyltransferase domain